jgi:hypothetical protein
MTEKLLLGGRYWTAVGESNAEHDDWMTGALRRAGLIPLPGIGAGESHAEYGQRIYADLSAHGERFNVLAGVLLPEGMRSEDWSAELAAETIAHLKRLVGPEDHQKMRDQLLSFLIAFFSNGTASSATSTSSSESETKASGPQPTTTAMEPGLSSSAAWAEETSTPRSESIATGP